MISSDRIEFVEYFAAEEKYFLRHKCPPLMHTICVSAEHKQNEKSDRRSSYKQAVSNRKRQKQTVFPVLNKVLLL